MESRHFESKSAPPLTPQPPLPPPRFEKSGYAPGNADNGERRQFFYRLPTYWSYVDKNVFLGRTLHVLWLLCWLLWHKHYFLCICRPLKKDVRHSPTFPYVCKWDMCWRNFCVFSLVTQNVKSRPIGSILKCDFQKKKQLHFSEGNYLNFVPKKDIVLHVTFPSFLKQGLTRTNSGPIWVPLA